ncbi:DUF2278 family protein [Streptomyces sp. TRM49041]|uniref:DUF2278 family protein n=1 Tax=Streptomyces sp. TRM49041 TaxID=2603216 RepID=UPI0011EC3412|nr:DUF2278 family protein [Streptomyces sp. TRM49041]
MPLDSYGVLAGTLHRHFRDRPDAVGRWYHVNLLIDAPAGLYHCAIDVDSHQSATGVRWKVLTLDAEELGPAGAARPGYHDLAREPGSRALDFIRHPALVDGVAWTAGSHVEATLALEPILVRGRSVLVFGEPFRFGRGMHNIHQNQGDPYGSDWWEENGTWQDGATLTLREDGRYDAFLSKFSTQADMTDDDGHPA